MTAAWTIKDGTGQLRAEFTGTYPSRSAAASCRPATTPSACTSPPPTAKSSTAPSPRSWPSRAGRSSRSARAPISRLRRRAQKAPAALRRSCAGEDRRNTAAPIAPYGSGTRRPPRGGIPRRCDGTRVPTRQPRGRSRPQETRAGLLESLAGSPGTSRSRGLPFGTRVRRFLYLGHTLASRSAPSLERRDRTLSH